MSNDHIGVLNHPGHPLATVVTLKWSQNLPTILRKFAISLIVNISGCKQSFLLAQLFIIDLITSFFSISLQIGEVKVPLCMVDLAQTIEEWKDIQSLKVDDQVLNSFLIGNLFMGLQVSYSS